MNKLSDELQTRGFVHQTTYKQLSDLDDQPITFYWGVDPSSDSMTIGNLAAAMMIRHFISAGHKAVLLVGGATGKIGDPDGKKQERDLKSDEQIAKNIDGLKSQYQKIFEGTEFEIVNNYDWFKELNYLDFLREIGKHMSMTQLLDREFVQARIGQDGSGISYAEFSYNLIQGYDFLHLSREKGVSLQLSGADQWGNCLSGVEMIRKIDGKEAHVFTMPLVVNKTTGVKFGKTEDGAVWLDPAKTSIFDFYQWWLNVGDADVEDYLKIFTLLSLDEISHIVAEFNQNPSSRSAQHILAKEVTTIVHGAPNAEAALAVTAVLFAGKDLSELSEAEKQMLAEQIPTTSSASVVEILVNTKQASSNSEANRLLAAGSISVAGEKILEDKHINGQSLLKKGKNNFIYVVD